MSLLVGLGLFALWRLDRALASAESYHLALARGEAQLRALAAAHFRAESGAHTLQPTALVHEAWLKLAGDGADVAIEKTYTFANYFETIAFVNALALIAHRQDHHPDLSVHYNRCVVRFNTHDVGGISDTDIDCAQRVDALLTA